MLICNSVLPAARIIFWHTHTYKPYAKITKPDVPQCDDIDHQDKAIEFYISNKHLALGNIRNFTLTTIDIELMSFEL